jgi:UrcA family protein
MTYARPLIAALLIASAAPVLAQDNGLAIKTDDLNLSSEAGRATLERRITGIERQLCMSATATGSRSRAMLEQKACKASVRSQIEAKIPAARKDG